MSRIRTVKPDLFRHEELFNAEMACQLPLRLTFIGLFTCCDREGRFKWRTGELKTQILPYDTVDMEKILSVLQHYGFIKRYCIDNKCYGYIPSWHAHQTINHREAKSVLPSPVPANQPTSASHQTQTQSHATPTSAAVIPLNQHPPSATSLATLLPTIEHVFSHWKITLQYPNAKLDQKRKTLIYRALQAGYRADELCQAIDGCSKTPYNMGDNDRQQRFDRLELILRDADHIERFIHNAKHPPKPSTPSRTTEDANARMLKQWTALKITEADLNPTDEPVVKQIKPP